jgi:geranylgeranyl diphosphate synthase type I
MQSPAHEPLTFAALLARTKPAIEARLETLWQKKLATRGRHGQEVRSIVDISTDLTLRGGKRYRAGLLAAAYYGVAGRGSDASIEAMVFGTGPDAEAILSGGISLELLQSYLLIQDDWMDGDVERRGGPSAHVALSRTLGDDRKGAAGAILAGDLVWSMAVDALLDWEGPAERRLAALKLFTQIHEDVVVGQVLDTLSRDADIEELHALKTGSYTVRGPLLLGATLAGATRDDLAALERFAAPIGVAFQLRDDLIGVFGSEKEAGRPEASDLRSAKNQAVVREAFPHLSQDARQKVDAVWGKLDADRASVAAAVEAIEATGARQRVEARLKALVDEAESLAAALPFPADARRLLAEGASALRAIPAGGATRAPAQAPRREAGVVA